jgi:hypothetical protein
VSDVCPNLVTKVGQKQSDTGHVQVQKSHMSDFLSDFCLTFCLKSRKSTKISEKSEIISLFLINFRALLKFIKIGEKNSSVLD